MLVVAMVLTGNTFATSSLLSSARAKYPQIVNTKLNSCTLCHTATPALNSYGQAFNGAGRNTAAFTAIENLDSDGDGFGNLVEINAGTFPGDRNDRPQQVTTTTAAQTTTTTTVPSSTTTTTSATTTTTIPAGLNALNFPQVAVGGGYRAFLMVNNPGTTTVGASAVFRNPGGQPLTLLINGASGSALNFSIPGRGSVNIALSDAGEQVKTGWCQVSASGSVGGALVYQSIDAQNVVSQASVLPSPPLRRFNMLVPQLGGQTLTGLALANMEQTAANLTLRFIGPDGIQLTEGTEDLQPGQQKARFINEYLPAVSASAAGVLEVSSSGNITAVGLVYVIGITPEFFTIPVLPVP